MSWLSRCPRSEVSLQSQRLIALVVDSIPALHLTLPPLLSPLPTPPSPTFLLLSFSLSPPPPIPLPTSLSLPLFSSPTCRSLGGHYTSWYGISPFRWLTSTQSRGGERGGLRHTSGHSPNTACPCGRSRYQLARQHGGELGEREPLFFPCTTSPV